MSDLQCERLVRVLFGLNREDWSVRGDLNEEDTKLWFGNLGDDVDLSVFVMEGCKTYKVAVLVC